jgi:hypothetical protein
MGDFGRGRTLMRRERPRYYNSAGRPDCEVLFTSQDFLMQGPGTALVLIRTKRKRPQLGPGPLSDL